VARRDRRNRPVPSPQPAPQEPTPPTQRMTTVSGWQGPLPPPSALEEFERIVPGAAARIIKQFEDEAAHRRELEDRESRLLVRDTHVGQFLAGLYATMAFAVVAYAVSQGALTVAAAIGGGTALGVGITAFLRRSKKS
jgi:uncharacterized membrane protein